MSKQTKIPVVEVAERKVSFDYDCFSRIEEGLGMGVFEIASMFNGYSALPISERVKPESERRPPTEEEKLEATRRIRLGMMAKFVAACVNVELVSLPTVVPPSELKNVFSALSVGFSAGLSGVLDEDEEANPTDSAASSAPSTTSGSGASPSSESPATPSVA